jgi:hypothetical protein
MARSGNGSPGIGPTPALAVRDGLVDRLAALGDPFFALLDAACDRRILGLIREGGCPFHSLYESPKAEELAEFAPYLVELSAAAPLFRRLVAEGWGESWGLYLGAPADLDGLRHHFRRFLKVEIPGGRTALFRFYDPRVLREFLPSWTPEEAAEFFGPVSCFAIEGDDPDVLLEFRISARGELSRAESTPGATTDRPR